MIRCLLFPACALTLAATPALAHPGHEALAPEAAQEVAVQANAPDAPSQPVITPDIPPQRGAQGLDGEAKPWTSLEALDAEARFHFVVVSDRTGNHRPGVWQEAMDKIDLMQPAFVVSVGDLIEGYTEDRRQLKREWDEIDAMIKTLDAPFFYVSGNHDYSTEVMAQVWAERLGASYYSFKYKGALFVVLNSALFDREGIEGYGKRGGDWAKDQAAQLAWLDETLKTNEDARWTFMFMHRPYWLENWVKPPVDPETGERPKLPATGPWETHKIRPPEWAKVEEMLGARPYTLFAWHEHVYEYDETPGVPHQHRIRLASTGGASGLRGVDYGSFDHFVWVTMTDDGPVIANVLLDGVLPKDFEMKHRRPWFAPRDPSDPKAGEK
ncbi:MAG: metallophosphoesterase [Pseudomonadota bacterium]